MNEIGGGLVSDLDILDGELVIPNLLFSVIVFIMDFLVIYSPLSKCFISLEPICRTVDLCPICGEFFCLFLSPTDRSVHDKKPR